LACMEATAWRKLQILASHDIIAKPGIPWQFQKMVSQNISPRFGCALT
jgi:molybdopterin-biosynthesis enzyme MoeA-like protein